MLSADRIRELLGRLNAHLAREETVGEPYVVSGTVMALAFSARAATNDVDAVFRPPEVVRRAARRVAAEAGVDEHWLDDAVKGFLSPEGDFVPWLQLDHLHVFVASPEYLLAMKCVAFRLGAEFHDEGDVRFLLDHLGLRRAEDALAVVERYFPASRIPPKTRFALEELLGG